MKTTSTIAITLAIGVSLSGCQALFGPRTAHVDSVRDAHLASEDQAVHPALDQGRQLLKAGRIAQAIEVLRIAQRDPASMADASNGLGVAYAKLGRHDLADRYFRMAVALRPDETRFTANMLRLQRDHDLAVRRNEEAAQLAKRANEDRLARLAKSVEHGRIERVSRGQVQIKTQTIPGSVASKVEVLAMHTSKTNQKPALTATPTVDAEVKTEAESSLEKKGYPLTIEFGKRISPNVIAPPKRDYPVRVYIGA